MTPKPPSPLSFSRALLAGAVGLVAFGIFCTIAWMIFSARAEADAAEAGVAAQADQSDALRRLALQGAATKNERASLAALAIPAGGNAAFISSVEDVGKMAHAGASVSSVGAVAPAGDTPGSLTLSVQFSGSYAQCLRFLRLVETMPRALSVSSLALQSEGAGVWDGSLSLSVLSFDAP